MMKHLFHKPLQQSHKILLLLSGFLILTACYVPRKGPQRQYDAAAVQKPFDAVIVPGVPFNGTSWDTVMKARVIWSWVLYKNGYAKNIIYSGGAVYTPYKEAVIMGLYGQQLGIPKEHMYYDTLARHSTENVYYSYQLAKQLGFKSIALATDPFQAFMLRGFTRRRFGTPVYHIPFVADSLEIYNGVTPKINPRSAKVANWTGITEEEGFFRRLRGTMGRDIDFKKEKGGRLPPL